MEKHRQRPSSSRDGLIIERPDLQTLWQKYSYGFFTALAWTIWLYLWLPLVSLIAWLFGVQVFYEHMILLGGYRGFLQLLTLYGSAVLFIAVVLIVWALSNQIRFRGKERRAPIPPATQEETARFFKISVDAVARAQAADRMVIAFDETSDAPQLEEAPEAPMAEPPMR
ncbi:MAG: poly-beta-1,6-N-acetyl-D-glucosamine biosynthesis protein PgaD [bacterium]|nr:poly-beta-1,6-N-acetyl-D-glucosamine biosynthesis protein PgaD [bacterium]